LNTPFTQGVDKRHKDGALYVRALLVKDEARNKQRAKNFEAAMKPYIQDFGGWWDAAVEEMTKLFAPLKAFDFEQASNLDLQHHLLDLLKVGRRHWELHMIGMNVIFEGWVMFENMCKELLGIDDQTEEFMTMVIGFDSKAFQVDKEMWQLAQDAIQAGLKEIFMLSDTKELQAKLSQSDAGKEWLKSLDTFLIEHGWRMQRMHDFFEPTWIEAPIQAILSIKAFMKTEDTAFKLDGVRQQLSEKREQAVSEAMKKVPEEKKELFTQLLDLAQHAGSYSEGHTYYHEMQAHAIIRNGLMGIGRRLADGGAIDKAEDVFFLIPDELEMAILVPEQFDLRYLVEPRKKQRESWHEIQLPPVLTTRENMMEAFMMDMAPANEAISAKVVQGGLPAVRPELNADFYGAFGAPGFVEGTARVILSPDQLDEIEPGDIVVAPNTATSWTPYFELIAGLVIDRGGTLSHGSVVGREYGIPVVANTGDKTGQLVPASRAIKTGQRIRVDGSGKAVYIL
jgi:phosphohistidine swiveling domain-containing protein